MENHSMAAVTFLHATRGQVLQVTSTSPWPVVAVTDSAGNAYVQDGAIWKAVHARDGDLTVLVTYAGVIEDPRIDVVLVGEAPTP